MSDPYKKVRPGDRLVISARGWNRAQEAADRVLGAAAGFEATRSQDFSHPYTWVYAQNITGTTVARWDVLSIVGVADQALLQGMPVLTVGDLSLTENKPSTDVKAYQRCVAVEPIANMAIGRVAVAGTVLVRASDVAQLPEATVLWTGVQSFALVRLDGGKVIELGTIEAPWPKGTNKQVFRSNDDGTPPDASQNSYFLARNFFANVTGTGSRRVACARVGKQWFLIAAEC